MTRKPALGQPKYLGIEGGGTRTVAVLADAQGQLLRRVETGPANLKLVTDAQLTRLFRSLAAALPRPDAIAIGLAGGWAEPDWRRIRAAAARAWPNVPCHATNDLETALAAASLAQNPNPIPQVLIVCGTGSGFFGKTRAGQRVKVGGWGHLLGDRASGYDLGLRALQAVAHAYDRTGAWPPLGQRLLRTLQFNEPRDLIDWAQSAGKADIAALAVQVFTAWSQRDHLAAGLVQDAAQTLAHDAALCAGKLASRGQPVQFVLTGSVLLKQPRFAAKVGQELRRLWPGAVVGALQRESVWGAVDLARKLITGIAAQGPMPKAQSPSAVVQGRNAKNEAEPGRPDFRALIKSTRLSPTEQRNPLSLDLDRMPLRKAIELMLSEDAKVPRQILAEAPALEKAVTAIVQAFRRGGRLFYVGAGTSGRLGVLDASECPPTFRAPPELVQGVMAGGQQALWQEADGAEDDAGAGARALEARAVTARDVVVGIAASGTTPYVWGALSEARRRRATTVLLCFNPFLSIPKPLRPTILIAPNLGPELLTGSTRLKAGTATKLILNLFTTLGMVGLGKVSSNLMIDLHPSNLKLRDRAVRILRELTAAEEGLARVTLQRCHWRVRDALALLRKRRPRKPNAPGRRVCLDTRLVADR